jgi:hypothetical protein
MCETSDTPEKPVLPVGTLVKHTVFGRGRVVGERGEGYEVLFKNGEVKQVAFTFNGMFPDENGGDAELFRIKEAVGELLGHAGWRDMDLELSSRWGGGMLKMIPGQEGVQGKELPIENFFKKIIGIREKLRVLEQKINNHPSLESGEKLELQAYITRCYGSLTSFNSLFEHKASHFKGSGKGG